MDESTSVEQRNEAGRAARAQTPRRSHAEWSREQRLADPATVVTAGDHALLPWLVTTRHARMAESPFAFHQASVALMAADLASTPTSGIEVQLVGDAHLANFGSYTAPGGTLAFGVDDAAATMPGPWEWDLKRLAASVVVTARHNGFPGHAAAEVRSAMATYRLSIAQMAASSALDVWYARLAPDQITRAHPSKRGQGKGRPKHVPVSERHVGKLVEVVDGQPRLRSHGKLLRPARDLGDHVDEVRGSVERALPGYVESLGPVRGRLLDRFVLADVGLATPGVSGVGTRRYLVLLADRDHGDTVVLQASRVGPSVLEPFLATVPGGNPAERVVQGRRLLELDDDVFLGASPAEAGADPLVWRQFRQVAGAADVAAMDPDRLAFHVGLCAWTLARGHARSGDAAAIAGYLGKGRAFERSVTAFAQAYADQNEHDYDSFRLAIEKGLVTVPTEP